MPPPSERELLRDRPLVSTLSLGIPQSMVCAYPFRLGAPTVPLSASQPAPRRTALWVAMCVWLARGDKQQLRLRCPPCQAMLALGAPGSFRPTVGLVGS